MTDACLFVTRQECQDWLRPAAKKSSGPTAIAAFAETKQRLSTAASPRISTLFSPSTLGIFIALYSREARRKRAPVNNFEFAKDHHSWATDTPTTLICFHRGIPDHKLHER
ncbi:hypothetical protein Zmor_016746 [Zophobas morio]|uniref:Uncharacterized protein n=1 Tax=Zophobas morio TaxID=2755281 RepID=A0AA38MBZ1_9CUCU|nr:hypothetical protein Zmor_016746 [Zophobas morio]